MSEAPRPTRNGAGEAAPDEARATTPTPLFLHRQTYRRRRIMDAARLLPFFGGVLLLLPVLWSQTHSTAMAAVYLFVAWLGLIATAALLARRLSEPLRGSDPEKEGGG